MATEKTKNISGNNLEKFQKSLSELKSAYDSDRPGFKDFSSRIISKIDELQILIQDAHKVAERLDANDRNVIPELQKLVDKFDKELRVAKGKEKDLLELKRKNCLEGIASRKKLLNLK